MSEMGGRDRHDGDIGATEADLDRRDLHQILKAWALGDVDKMNVVMLGAFLRQFGKAPDLAEAAVPTFAPEWEFGRCITCTSPMTSEESIASDCCTACLTGPAEPRIGRDTDDPYGG